MAKVIIAGDAVVIKSALKLEDIQTVEKYRKEALRMMGGEDNKEVVFVVTAAGKTASLNSVGVSFVSASRDEDKLATLTLAVPSGVADVKEWFADTYGAGFAKLSAMEEVLPEVLESILAERAAIKESITVMQ